MSVRDPDLFKYGLRAAREETFSADEVRDLLVMIARLQDEIEEPGAAEAEIARLEAKLVDVADLVNDLENLLSHQ